MKKKEWIPVSSTGMTSLDHSDDIHNPVIPARDAGIQ
ncbi:WPE palindromic element domain-containing protein [Wolbachia endosymbiont of Ctenocephalides felis wCfeJ]|nr:WPE palindromic element domain-containing protein [Wolbachia endosymbiont of Ctenocephalides felis wCfeJ]